MRTRTACLLLLATFAGLATLSLTSGQDRDSPPPTRPVPSGAPKTAAESPPTPRDLSRLTDLQRQIYYSAQRGAEWLFRMNGVKGRFTNGHLPALDAPLEGDHFLRQAEAAQALAHAARFTREERYAARATQAVLALLDETVTDPKDPQVRYTGLSPALVNRLAAAGSLILAINELPAPQQDLLDKSEQLCNYVRRQVRTDGSLAVDDGPGKSSAEVSQAPGVALYALMRSQKHRPAAWKTDVVRKAAGYYRSWWRDHKDPTFVPWQTAAYAEAYLATKEQAFADFVYEMNDWLCNLQYGDNVDPRHLQWLGGFMAWEHGKAVAAMPGVESALYAESLAHACRVAREAGDLQRHERFRPAVEGCLRFLTTLQYVEANTRHFESWYRQKYLLGGFHASPVDGNLRLDYTRQTVAAMLVHLEQVVR
jgi:hypothetical protein